MIRKSPKAESKEASKYQSLIQQLQNLEREWDSMEKSRPGNSHFSSSSSPSIDHHLLMLKNNSPRSLMSSLQHTDYDPGMLSRPKASDAAIEEILKDRQAALDTGKLKGRQLLFPASYKELELDHGGRNDESFLYGWGSGEEGEGVEEKQMVVVEGCGVVEKKKAGRGGVRRGGGGWFVAAGRVMGMLVLIYVGVVVMWCNNGKSVDEKEVGILVPT